MTNKTPYTHWVGGGILNKKKNKQKKPLMLSSSDTISMVIF